MTVYVRAARRFNSPTDPHRGGQITGGVLHLATFQLEDPLTAAVPMGADLPLCGGRQFVRPVERWALTGPNYTGWRGHAHWPLCQRCRQKLAALWADAAEQDGRRAEHERTVQLAASISTAIPERTNPDA